MAARFFGRYEHSLDIKGRIILPARFRTDFGPQAYITQHLERCLALWPTDEFEKQMTDQERLQEVGQTERNLARFWAAGTSEVDIDRQGRLAIPGYLREFARLDGAVLITGALNRVELWNPAEWDLRVRPAEAQLTGEPELVGAVASPTPPTAPVGPPPDPDASS